MSRGAVMLAALLFLYCGLQEGQCARILALLNLASPSHYIFNRALLIALANKGHQVTVVTTEVEKHPVPNMKTIVMDGIYDTSIEYRDPVSLTETSAVEMTFITYDWGHYMCEKQLQSAGAQELLNYSSSEKFELIITEAGWGECFFGFIHKFGSPPVVATSGIGVPPWISLTTGNPENPSYMPNFLLPYTSRMSFSERICNFLTHIFVTFLYEYSYIPRQEALARKYFKQDLPPFMDIWRNFSIVLVNTLAGLDDPRPLLPSVVPIGGMHIKPQPDPLPQDLKTFLDEAKDGFIFFSLGTNLRSNKMALDKRQAFLEAFSELSQSVLWKFESGILPGKPPNLKIGKWLPQSDILAHPNIRMFITHCGMMSSVEAAYRGVPIVGIPFFLDQKVNAMKFVKRGLGVQLHYDKLTKESVLTAVREILNNDSYRTNMRRLSAVFRDQPQTPLDRAVYWTEYVIRHKGAPHLRSAAADLSWYQYLLLDVILVLSTGALLVVLISYLALRTLYRILTRKPTKKEKTK
ncbi:UDP-glucuronosyltransferase 2B31 [Cryptotermes secundus]|uniref:UDP-glucuronosyltransferase 2B31 n=1 Tax=Cryptotermes secundus TaxID=105785 RepID=A0A2J7PYR5_9NEOP|nr:UDP-glucuronosyltransferase 2A3 [Cryptotermes secundus]XP_023719422.1 UDP-glucuronosyltransferase 2A3 [Cryptotermes secundus]PNF21497.1 UDP-glucuronosyltransferase 2B31 [Cryptotermes secundus]